MAVEGPASVSLEPQISHAAAIAWLVLESIQSVEVIDRKSCNGFWRGESNVDGHASASILLEA